MTHTTILNDELEKKSTNETLEVHKLKEIIEEFIRGVICYQ